VKIKIIEVFIGVALTALITICFLGIHLTTTTDKYSEEIVLTVSPDNRLKLEKLKRIEFSVAKKKHPSQCRVRIRDFYVNGDSLQSGNIDETSDYVRWRCTNEFSYLKCPEFVVSIKNDNVIANTKKSIKKQISKEIFWKCVNSAIEWAPTELQPKTKQIRIRDQEAKNKASWL